MNLCKLLYAFTKCVQKMYVSSIEPQFRWRKCMHADRLKLRSKISRTSGMEINRC